MAIPYSKSGSGIVGVVTGRQTAQNRPAAINKIPPVTGHFQATPTMAKKGRLKINVIGTAYMLKGASLTARAKSVIKTTPAKPTINPARYNFF